MPVEDIEVSAAYTEHWNALAEAQLAVLLAFNECKSGVGISAGKRRQLEKLLKKFKKAIDRCDRFVGKAMNEAEGQNEAEWASGGSWL
jgi:hypothetical protein